MTLAASDTPNPSDATDIVASIPVNPDVAKAELTERLPPSARDDSVMNTNSSREDLSRYGVTLVISNGEEKYDVPVITITYQASPYSKPVEVGHAYVRTKPAAKGSIIDYDYTTLHNAILRSYVASIKHALESPQHDTGQAFIHQPNARPEAQVTTYFVGAEPTKGEALAKTGYFAYVQIFTPDAQFNIPGAHLLAGYKPQRVLTAIGAMSESHSLRSGRENDGHVASLKENIAVAVKRRHLLTAKEMKKFEPEHTIALGNWAGEIKEEHDSVTPYRSRAVLEDQILKSQNQAAARDKARAARWQSQHPTTFQPV